MSGGHTRFGEADEIVDDARMRLEQLRVRGFSGGAPEFKAYLYRVVVSACMDAGSRHRFTHVERKAREAGGRQRPLMKGEMDWALPLVRAGQ